MISGEPFEVRLVYINNFTARNIPLLMANANRENGIKEIVSPHVRHCVRIVVEIHLRDLLEFLVELVESIALQIKHTISQHNYGAG